jgi:hypothetical protein
MRVKWNRNLDGVRPLITVPETEVISDAKFEVQNNDNNISFPDLNDNTTNNDSQNVIKVRTCESPSPSSASVTSKRSDKSKTRISSLFSLLKLKEKAIIDNNNEDCVSNYSELSNSAINPIINNRRKSYESRDSMISGQEKIGFEADTRRRRRANTLLLKSSMRRSWQQLNGHSKLSVSAGYLVCREPRISNYTHSPLQSLRRKVSEPDLFTSRSSQNRAITDVLPQVLNELNYDNSNVETNKTCLNINSVNTDININSVNTDINIDELHSNDIIDKTVEQTFLNDQIKCITSANLNEQNSLNGCGCDKVQNVTKIINSLDSQQNSINNSKTITDLKNNDKNNIIEHKLSSDKNTNIVNNTVSKVKLRSDICVTNTNDILDLDSDKTDSININIVEKTSLSNDQINDHFMSIKQNISEENNINCNNVDKESEQSIIRVEELESIELITNKQINTSSTSISTDIVKVKVKKNQLPEFEVVSFTSNRSPSPSTVSNSNSYSYTNDEPVVVTFIDDEPMIKADTKCDVLVKSTPIQGILRLRSNKDSNSEDNSSDSLTKTMGPKISQKKVHFADSCLHNRHTNRVRSRPLKSRHYGSYGTIRTIRTNL